MKRTLIPARFSLVFSTFLLTLLLYVDRACISAAKSDISNDLGFSMTDFGWIMAIFTLGYALFQTPAGKLADKYGARGAIASIVAIWSVLTAFTGAAWNYTSMLIIRFLFGAGEAGAFPALSKVVYNWFPIGERGIVQGINFSGSRLGAAFAMPLVAWMLNEIGWRQTFVVFGVFGILYGALWYVFFRNKPENSKYISSKELKYIKENRQQPSEEIKSSLPFSKLIQSTTMWKTMLQYICSNFTFYFSLTWMFPYIQERFDLGLVEAGFYTSIPLIGGAIGNWVSGFIVDAVYRKGNWKLSRRLPAIIGFLLSAIGMIMVTQVSSPVMSIAFMTMAVFGADMTLSPSWAFCIDVGQEHAGVTSGTMNMAGNLGAFITIIAFPYFFEWTGSYEPFFITCAVLSLIAILVWFTMDPEKTIVNNN
ncbi:MFS transporter [Algibacter sp. R77976]|uniref:MFS transporter n=1 Tax=Algibacter sp. R77976 TaxID=3093873 RepID=UPI0037CBB9D8